MNRFAPVALCLAVLAAPLAAKADGPVRQVWHRTARLSIHLLPDGRSISDQTWEVTADTPSAARVAAQQTFGFSGALEHVTVVEAYTQKADGRRIPVAPGAILSEATGATVEYPSFSDWQARSIIFPDVAAGDTVHYVLHRETTAPLFPGQFETDLRPGPYGNLTAVDISIAAPAGLTLHIATNGLAEASPVTSATTVTRTWRLAASDDPGAPVELEASTFGSYAALGDAYAARALPAATPTAPIQVLADRLTQGVTDRREQTRILYERVAQRIRYVALQLGTGRVVPHDAATVLALGYGDCKDHAALLGALLAAKGIFSEPALITAKPRYDLPSIPTLAVLDHVILYVPEFDLFLDSTSPFAPFGTLPFGDYGKPVVLAGPGGARLAHTPPVPQGLAVTTVSTDETIAKDGSVSGSTVTKAAGPSAIALREVAASIEERGPVDAAEDQLRRLGTPGQGGFSFATPLDLTSSYGLTGEFELEDKLADGPTPRFALPAGLTVLVRAGAFLVAPTETDAGGHVCYAGRQVETIHLHLPPELHSTVLPPDVSVTAGYASYQARYAAAGDGIDVRRSFTLTAPHPLCSEAEYDAMRPVLEAAHRDEHAEIGLERGTGSAEDKLGDRANHRLPG